MAGKHGEVGLNNLRSGSDRNRAQADCRSGADLNRYRSLQGAVDRHGADSDVVAEEDGGYSRGKVSEGSAKYDGGIGPLYAVVRVERGRGNASQDLESIGGTRDHFRPCGERHGAVADLGSRVDRDDGGRRSRAGNCQRAYGDPLAEACRGGSLHPVGGLAGQAYRVGNIPLISAGGADDCELRRTGDNGESVYQACYFATGGQCYGLGTQRGIAGNGDVDSGMSEVGHVNRVDTDVRAKGGSSDPLLEVCVRTRNHNISQLALATLVG